MPKKQAKVEYNDFTRGFITEANPLTFPENASINEANMNINRDGSRQRRYGLDWKDGFHTVGPNTPLSSTNEAVAVYEWRAAGNVGSQNILVMQNGAFLYFYDMDDDNVGSSGSYLGSFNLGGGATTRTSGTQLKFTQMQGDLVFTVGSQYAYRGVWNSGSGTITVSSYRLTVRDIWGIDDGFDVDDRSGALTTSRHYNLRNQGWPNLCTVASNAGGSAPSITAQDPVTYTFTSLGNYPAHSTLFWACKMSAVTGVQTDNIGAFSPWEIDKLSFGSTWTPRGRYIIDLFSRGGLITNSRTGASGLGGLPNDVSNGYLTNVQSFAGRLWYSIYSTAVTGGDDRSPNLSSMLMYSQASNNFQDWGKCYTENDLTNEDTQDVLETDGGFIRIADIGEVLGMEVLGQSLIVIATNGVWEIFGGDTGFSATVQSVNKVTDQGALNYNSIVKGETGVAYWAADAIIALEIDPATGRVIPKNITEETVQDWYDDIPLVQKRNARGDYDRLAKQISWLYAQEATANKHYYTHEMVFDVMRGAFVPRTVSPPARTGGGVGPYPIAHVPVTQKVVSDGTPQQETKSSMMYWLSNSDNGTQERYYIGGYVHTGFYDYRRVESGGTDNLAYLLTGYLTGGDSATDKVVPWLHLKMKLTETGWSLDVDDNVVMENESRCWLQAQWQWTNKVESGKWTNPRQVYRLPRARILGTSGDFNFDVVSTRNKIRGSGEAVSFYMYSEAGYDMHLYGWGIDVGTKEN